MTTIGTSSLLIKRKTQLLPARNEQDEVHHKKRNLSSWLFRGICCGLYATENGQVTKRTEYFIKPSPNECLVKMKGEENPIKTLCTSQVQTDTIHVAEEVIKDESIENARSGLKVENAIFTLNDVKNRNNMVNDALQRLTRLIKQLEQSDDGHIPREELVENLLYTIEVLKKSSVIPSLKSDMIEMTEIDETNACPNEVREWINSTFTKASPYKPQPREKPRFKTVAFAIRAGIAVEKMYKRTIPQVITGIDQMSEELLKSSINYWSFDVFKLHNISENHSLKNVGKYLLQHYDLITKFKIPISVLDAFLTQLEIGYSKFSNPYHNILHGADVAQTCHSILHFSGFNKMLSDLEIFSLMMAGLVHDFEHTGTTNNFHINSGSDLAILYNDRGVLENHHISSIFRLIKTPEFNVCQNLSSDDYKKFRSLTIEMVLSTDMSSHFDQLKSMKSLVANLDRPERCKVLSLLLHCSDISHPSKAWDIHHPWTMALLEEFFRQGDKERENNMPFSPLCDRNTTLVAESQIGFIDFIVEPSFQVLTDVLTVMINDSKKDQKDPEIKEKLKTFDQPWLAEIQKNRTRWKEKAETEVLPGITK